MDPYSNVEQRIASLEAAVTDLQTCNRGNVTATLRMQAQASAVYSLLAEVTREQGFPIEVIRAHFRVRSDYYLDRLLADAELASPRLGAELDDRLLEEVPASEGYPRLFGSGEDDSGPSEPRL